MKMNSIPSSNYEVFIRTDTSAYKGQWVAIARKKVVAHGKDAEKVYMQAKKKYKTNDISLAKVPEEQVLVLRISL